MLSGSSARKLRRGGVNLLAGRAITTALFPLVSAELPFNLNLDRTLRFGMLPMALDGDDPGEYLRSYAETYLVEEVQAEALTRNIGAFARFLEIAALQTAPKSMCCWKPRKASSPWKSRLPRGGRSASIAVCCGSHRRWGAGEPDV